MFMYINIFIYINILIINRNEKYDSWTSVLYSSLGINIHKHVYIRVYIYVYV